MHNSVVLGSSDLHAAEKQGSSLLVGQRNELPKVSGDDIIGQFGRAQYAKGKMLLMSRGRHAFNMSAGSTPNISGFV